MGNNLFAYSGLAAKIKAMSSHLITDKEFREIASLSSVQNVAHYLKKHPSYQALLANFDNTLLHRGEMEYLLRYSVYNDYLRLYKFANQKQRTFFHLYFSRYEVQVLKVCLRKLFDNQPIAFDLNRFYPFFEKHSAIQLPKAVASSTIEELAESLKGSIYENIFRMVDSSSSLTLFDYEIALDLLHFTDIWKQINKMAATEQKILQETYGSQMDLLNIQWIYRSKRYYQITPSDIYTLLIPINYKLRKSTITAMAEAETAEEVLAILQDTYYAKHFKETELSSLEQMYHHVLAEQYEHAVRKYPYSVACISSYLYKKELEVNRLTSVLEGIRYQLPPEKILKIIL